MRRGRKKRPELMPSERNRIAQDAMESSKRLTAVAGDLDWGCEDRKQLERKAQSDRTFSNLIRRDK